MSYIGAEPSTAAFPFDQFSGTGAATSFTLTYAPAGTTSILVAISGVTQNPNLYSVIGTTLTFSPAPPAGTNNISVLYLGLPAVIGVPDVGSVTPAMLSTGGPSWNAGGTLSVAAISDSGNLAFTGTGNRITGDFSNATFANRVMFQSSTVNGNTSVALIPNGTSRTSNVVLYNTADTANSSRGYTSIGVSAFEIVSDITGTGTYLPTTLYTGGSERVRVDTAGNVGIGTSSPGTKFQINGQSGTPSGLSNRAAYFAVATANTNDAGVVLGSITGNFPYIAASKLGDGNATNLGFFTNDTERARIDASGNLLVGTTSNPAPNSGKLIIDGSSVVDAIQVYKNSTAAAGQIGFNNPNGRVGEIYTVGSSTTYTTSSDYRLKNSIAPMTGALARVALLKPVTYKWKADGANGQGFIAHELQAVVPECVSGEKDAMEEDGVTPKYQGIDTSFLVATLTAAIQELKAEFDAYKEAHP